ncbi:MAG: hypothetical protein ACOYJ2_09035, partial [Rickettsiales bacterium]
DVILGEDGNDTIWGGTGNNNIQGGAGNDLINTYIDGFANRTLESTNSLISGGADADIFQFSYVFNAAGNGSTNASDAHIITDFNLAQDRLGIGLYFDTNAGLAGYEQILFNSAAISSTAATVYNGINSTLINLAMQGGYTSTITLVGVTVEQFATVQFA